MSFATLYRKLFQIKNKSSDANSNQNMECSMVCARSSQKLGQKRLFEGDEKKIAQCKLLRAYFILLQVWVRSSQVGARTSFYACVKRSVQRYSFPSLFFFAHILKGNEGTEMDINEQKSKSKDKGRYRGNQIKNNPEVTKNTSKQTFGCFSK